MKARLGFGRGFLELAGQHECYSQMEMGPRGVGICVDAAPKPSRAFLELVGLN